MHTKLLGRTFVLGFIILWALYAMFPLRSGDLGEAFKKQAQNTDATFEEIVKAFDAEMAQENVSVYPALKRAIGTNDITKYFAALGDFSKEEDQTSAVLNRLQRKIAGKIHLGLDIKGGTSFLVGMDTTRLNADGDSTGRDLDNALNKAVEILRKRVDTMGVAEPQIRPTGTDRIEIALPGLTEGENEMARRQIERAAFLEFRMVHPKSSELISEGYVEPGYEILTETLKKDRTGKGADQTMSYLVKKKPEEGLTGKYITKAMVHRNPVDNGVAISFTLDSEGAAKFAKVTRENVGQLLAIVLDGELSSAPRINGEIPNGSGEITGNFTIEEGIELANVLQNPLETPVQIMEEHRVDPSLGADSIRSGIVACIISAILVSVFMFIYYMFAGIVANIAMILNLVIMVGALCLIGATLTIPGVAGIVLTIGMAVDANVLIYEHIREELAKGKSLRSAVAAGYDRVFGVIFDGNITTLIAGVIMIMMGSGAVRGFGVTLSIGILTSMYTALVVTRLVFDFAIAKCGLTKLRMLKIIDGTKIHFMKVAKPLFFVSWTVIVIGLIYTFAQGKAVLGVDFVGGDHLTLSFKQKIETEKVRATVGQVVEESVIGYQASLSGGQEVLVLTVPEKKGEAVESAIFKAYPEAGFERLSLDHVGATTGVEIARSAIKSLLIAMLGILIYVAMRYEFSFAVGSVVALVHDILITIGIFTLTGHQFSGPILAALLTIIGFSINDTIVIFDRVRENIKMGVKGTLSEIFDLALNQTLSRTIITSVTVFLSVLALYIFGGTVINDFAFTFMVGVIVGTWSSLFVSSAVVLWITKGVKPDLGHSDVAVEVVDPTLIIERDNNK